MGSELRQLSNTACVFRTKSTRSLAFSLAILNLCSLYRPLSRYGPQVLNFCVPRHAANLALCACAACIQIMNGLKHVGLSGLAHSVIRRTFFPHFCAGEAMPEVAEVVKRYERDGIHCILDYSVEVGKGPECHRPSALLSSCLPS